MTEEHYTEDNSTIQSSYEDDSLLAQIDAFRDKAKQLQVLINDKQKRVIDLEAQVRAGEAAINDKEARIQKLQIELEQKQKEADSLVTTVESQVDKMLGSVRDDLNSLGSRVETSVSDSSRQQSDELKEILSKVGTDLEGIKTSLEPNDDELSAKEVKDIISEKIHSENVQMYRNLQEDIKKLDSSDSVINSLDLRYQDLKKKLGWALLFGFVNLAAVIVLLLFYFNVI